MFDLETKPNEPRNVVESEVDQSSDRSGNVVAQTTTRLSLEDPIEQRLDEDSIRTAGHDSEGELDPRKVVGVGGMGNLLGC